VSGFMLKRSLNFRGFKLNIILAEEIAFTTKGDRVDISEILSSPEDYELRLVEVIGFGSQLPLIYDPDDGSNITRLPHHRLLVRGTTYPESIQT